MSAAIPIGTEVELLRAVATSIALIEKGKRGTVDSVENGWIFVRFRTPKAVVAVMPKEIKKVEAEAATEAGGQVAPSAGGILDYECKWSDGTSTKGFEEFDRKMRTSKAALVV